MREPKYKNLKKAEENFINRVCMIDAPQRMLLRWPDGKQWRGLGIRAWGKNWKFIKYLASKYVLKRGV